MFRVWAGEPRSEPAARCDEDDDDEDDACGQRGGNARAWAGGLRERERERERERRRICALYECVKRASVVWVGVGFSFLFFQVI